MITVRSVPIPWGRSVYSASGVHSAFDIGIGFLLPLCSPSLLRPVASRQSFGLLLSSFLPFFLYFFPAFPVGVRSRVGG
ncbi:hypothetical protein DFH09DRAFT_1181328 [Mycena vulgaris]|nr:hypothetical protein DFH09DRAFT_1181328 [Mycena vulgaris]